MVGVEVARRRWESLVRGDEKRAVSPHSVQGDAGLEPVDRVNAVRAFFALENEFVRAAVDAQVAKLSFGDAGHEVKDVSWCCGLDVPRQGWTAPDEWPAAALHLGGQH